MNNFTRRRSFLKLSSAFALAATARVGAADDKPQAKVGAMQRGLPAGWRQMRKIDVHNHVMENVQLADVSWAKVERTVATGRTVGYRSIVLLASDHRRSPRRDCGGARSQRFGVGCDEAIPGSHRWLCIYSTKQRPGSRRRDLTLFRCRHDRRQALQPVQVLGSHGVPNRREVYRVRFAAVGAIRRI